MELKTNKLDDFIDFETLNIKQKQNEIYIGDSIDGQVYWDYKRYPHALVGGGTGSGKTTFLLSLLTLLHQEKIKPEIHLIDFKGAELSLFKYSWLVKSFSKTKSDFAKTLNKLTQESTRRFELFAQNNVRNMYIYNEKSNTKLKHIFVVIDEFAVLEGEKDIQQELQMRVALDRAAGIHYIITTQSPRHQVVSGMLKANLELRLVFRTFNDLDSQILFDEKGAEKLKGNGEALFKTNKIVKIQCPFVSEATVEKAIKKYILKKETPVIQSNVQNKPKYPQKNKSIEQKDKIENPQKNKPKGVIKLC